MRLSKIFTEKTIITRLQSQTKKDLFEELVRALESHDDDIDAEEVLSTLWKREEMLNTRVAPGIAIPHTQVQHLEKTTGILGISKTGIEYGLSDGDLIHIVVMIVDDVKDTVEHLDTLRNFALLAKNSRFMEQLKNAHTPLEAAQIIARYETMLE